MGNVYYCTTPIMKVSLIFGLVSINVINNDGKQSAQFNKLYILLPVTYMVITALIIYEVVSSASTLDNSKYSIGVLYIGVLFIFIGNILTLYTIYIMNMLTSGSIAKVINKISKADELIKSVINKIDYRAHFKYEIYVISSSLLTVLVQIILHYFTLNCEQKLLDKKLLFLLSFPVIIRIILEFQYTMFIKLLHERFTILNKELYNLFQYKSYNCKTYNFLSRQSIKNSYWKEWITEEPRYIDAQLKYVEFFMKLHDTLSETGNMISRVFSMQILACFAIHLISEVFTVFYAYFEMMYHHYIPVLHWVGWIIITNLEMLEITAICHKTSNEASKTGYVINKLFLVTSINKSVKEKLFIFSQQIQHKRVKFSACGLFSIDGRLLFMITCASSTYLLVMFQYQEGIQMHCLSKNIS